MAKALFPSIRDDDVRFSTAIMLMFAIQTEKMQRGLMPALKWMLERRSSDVKFLHALWKDMKAIAERGDSFTKPSKLLTILMSVDNCEADEEEVVELEDRAPKPVLDFHEFDEELCFDALAAVKAAKGKPKSLCFYDVCDINRYGRDSIITGSVGLEFLYQSLCEEDATGDAKLPEKSKRLASERFRWKCLRLLGREGYAADIAPSQSCAEFIKSITTDKLRLQILRAAEKSGKELPQRYIDELAACPIDETPSEHSMEIESSDEVIVREPTPEGPNPADVAPSPPPPSSDTDSTSSEELDLVIIPDDPLQEYDEPVFHHHPTTPAPPLTTPYNQRPSSSNATPKPPTRPDSRPSLSSVGRPHPLLQARK